VGIIIGVSTSLLAFVGKKAMLVAMTNEHRFQMCNVCFLSGIYLLN
jgi:hypothetical protein